jgi:branched-chain amino acid transport system substrate-binding protein
MKKILMATVASTALTGAAFADAHGNSVTLGVILGFTGPIESLTPAMADGAELAMAEVTESGALMDGMSVTSIRADSAPASTAAAANAAAERLITSDGVDGIVGADCSGVTTSILTNVAVPNGMVMISPSATSPGAVDRRGQRPLLPHRAVRRAPGRRDVRDHHGPRLRHRRRDLHQQRLRQGLADSFAAAFEEMGGTVTLVAAHEDGKADYSAEVGALASAGGDVLVVRATWTRAARASSRPRSTPAPSTPSCCPTAWSPRAGRQFRLRYRRLLRPEPRHRQRRRGHLPAAWPRRPGFDGTSPFSAESYDAAALIHAGHAGGGLHRSGRLCRRDHGRGQRPRQPILPGELGMALEMIANGEDVDYVGASAVELIGAGESAGNYREIEIVGGELTVAVPLIALTDARSPEQPGRTPGLLRLRGQRP